MTILVEKKRVRSVTANALVVAQILIVIGCVVHEKRSNEITIVRPSNDSLYYEGRLKFGSDSTAIYYPGSGLTFSFTGTSASAWLKDRSAATYFNIVIDGDSLRFIKTDSTKQLYVLAEKLRDTVHTISLLKRTEWDKGTSWFYGLEVRGELLTPPKKSGKKIEFFGNSITAGYAIEDYTGGDSPDSTFTNNYYTYAAITARHFNADYYCTSRSGIGIMVSWFPVIMPEVYDRLDPLDPSSKWDFSTMQPDVVVINLFQNDSWLVKMPAHESFKARFGSKPPTEKQIVVAYRNFVQKIRSVYPSAFIVCALGSMDATKEGSPWPGYVLKAVEELADENIVTHFFPFTNKNGHPRKEDNAVMARSLIQLLETTVWKK
jgi:hypothetical protein